MEMPIVNRSYSFKIKLSFSISFRFNHFTAVRLITLPDNSFCNTLLTKPSKFKTVADFKRARSNLLLSKFGVSAVPWNDS